jgi:hypothetical protein
MAYSIGLTARVSGDPQDDVLMKPNPSASQYCIPIADILPLDNPKKAVIFR